MSDVDSFAPLPAPELVPSAPALTAENTSETTPTPTPVVAGRRVRGKAAAWTLAGISSLLLVAGGVFAFVFVRDEHRWDAAVADRQAQVTAIKAEHDRQNAVRAQRQQELIDIGTDIDTAGGHVACANAVQAVWSGIKKRDYEHGGPLLVAMVGYCRTKTTGGFTVTIQE
jgi:hypothetical protein